MNLDENPEKKRWNVLNKKLFTNSFQLNSTYGFHSLTSPSSLYEHSRFWWGWWASPITSFSWICNKKSEDKPVSINNSSPNYKKRSEAHKTHIQGSLEFSGWSWEAIEHEILTDAIDEFTPGWNNSANKVPALSFTAGEWPDNLSLHIHDNHGIRAIAHHKMFWISR